METLKQTIKQLSSLQLGLKNQRKTIKIVGDRTLSPLEAWRKHAANRDLLRHMNLAYGLLRGKTIEEIEPTARTPFWKSQLDSLVEKYKENIK